MRLGSIFRLELDRATAHPAVKPYVAEIVDPTGHWQLNGDCNADGLTNSQDVLSQLQLLTELTDVLPDVATN